MNVLGKILKEARDKKGISIEQLSQNLKISIYHLEAIEGGNFDKTPGDPYTLSFIKTYGKYFDLDLDLITTVYRDETNIVPNSNYNLPKIATYTNINYIKYSSASLLIILFAFGFYSFFLSKTYINDDYALVSEPDDNILALIEEDQLKKDLKILKEENKKITLVTNEKNKIVNDNTSKEQLTNSSDPRQVVASINSKDLKKNDNIILNMLGDTWIQIKNRDNQIILSKLMKENEKYFLNNKEAYFITTGNAGNIQLSIGEKSYGKLGKKGEILNSYELSELFQN